MTVDVYPLVSKWGRFGLYSYYIDSPEPAIIDTGISSSPAEGMAQALTDIGRDIADVKWILLTHGHIDHIGGAHALYEMTGRKANVVIHRDDSHLLESRQAHVDLYSSIRQPYLKNPDGIEGEKALTQFAIAGEFEATHLVSGGETISLGGDVSISVVAIPGHTAGSVAYVIDKQNDVFVGDAVQIHGGANGFPGYEDPVAYRKSLEKLRDTIRPNRLFLGHPYQNSSGESYGVKLDQSMARHALNESLDIEERITSAARKACGSGLVETNSPYSPFDAIADELHYTGDPRLDPSPFFTTLHGYRQLFEK